MTETTKENWTLKKLSIEFQKGYSFNETKDHYVGRIEFSNGENESFVIKLREDMTEPYLKLVAQEVIKSSQELANRMAETLNFKSE